MDREFTGIRTNSKGDKKYYVKGKLHRDGDLPAIERADGDVSYWKHGKRHRDGDQPAIIRSTGTLEYWRDGIRHRDGGPAVIHFTGDKIWWYEGKWIREEREHMRPTISMNLEDKHKR